MRLVLAVTGASGVKLAMRFIELLPSSVELHLIVSKGALNVQRLEEKSYTLHDSANLAASVSSGSFKADAYAIIPCSINTLAKIAGGIADTLPTRIGAVALKEQRKLLLAPREMPYSTIALEQMHKLSSLGVIIAPPVMGYYADTKTLEEMERFIVGRWFDQLGIKHDLYKRWGE